MNYNYDDLMSSLLLMGQGMLAIFIVMAAIALIVFFITKFGKKKDKQQ